MHIIPLKASTIGYISTLLGVSSMLPVLHVVYKTHKTNNFPKQTLIIAMLSNFLWIVYGLQEKANASIFMGLVYLLIYSFILIIKTQSKNE